MGCSSRGGLASLLSIKMEGIEVNLDYALISMQQLWMYCCCIALFLHNILNEE